MRALSLWQPWASLVAAEAKRIETRSWPTPTSLLGTRIAIYATKGGLRRREFVDVCHDEPFVQALGDAGYYGPLELPRGAIVATAVIERCRPITAEYAAVVREDWPDEYDFGDYSCDHGQRYAWELTDVERPPDPIACSATRQGIWQLPRHVAAELGGGQLTLVPAGGGL